MGLLAKNTSRTIPVPVDASRTDRVDRGGNWNRDAHYTRVFFRFRGVASRHNVILGFRFLRNML